MFARRAVVVAACVAPPALLFACGKAEPKAPGAIADAAPRPADAAAFEAAMPIEARPETIPVPLPSGDYEVSTEVVKDTCSAGDAGASTPRVATMFVQMKAWRDKSGKERITGNFPLPLPSKGGYGSARADIALEPPDEPKPITLHGLGTRCPDYETRTLHALLEKTASTVKVSYAREYGDATSCKRTAPSRCALEYVYTYRLVQRVCDPHCGVKYEKTDAGLVPKCECPTDAGAP